MLLTTEKIGFEVGSIKPYNVAVAFIGNDWNKFIDIFHLKKIIISPTFGSNPNAIESLIDIIGWDKIYFLDNLHAKFYIGENSAIVGSANLTRNGLSIDYLQEAAIKTEDPQTRSELLIFFNKLESQANEQYPNVEMKKRKLGKLKQQWNCAIRNSFITPEEIKPKLIQNYTTLGSDDFYIVWYQNGLEYEYSENVESVKKLILDEMHLAETDQVEKGKWLLSWKITNNDRPYKKVMPTWMFIDEIIENGVIASADYEYTKLALMFDNNTKMSPPFEITEDFYETFTKIVTNKKYSQYFIGNDEPYLVSKSFSVFEEFISEIKNNMKS